VAISPYNRKFAIAVATGWIIWASLGYRLLADFGAGSLAALSDSMLSNALLFGGCFLISNNMRYYLPGKEKYWYVLLLGVIVTLLWMTMLRLSLPFLLSDDKQYVAEFYASLSIRMAVGFLVITSSTLLSLIWYTQQQEQDQAARKQETDQAARDAELLQLQNRLQPHFLFNSLNSVSALTISDPGKARDMIEQLSAFLRGSLQKEHRQWSTLEEELDYLRLYMGIEKVRFGYRLQTEINCDESTLQMRLPNTILQPVVENAIKFGLYDTLGEVCIRLTAQNSNGFLQIEVSNPFDQVTAVPRKGAGFGLASVRRRLFLLFARQDLLQTEMTDTLFITRILIPQI